MGNGVSYESQHFIILTPKPPQNKKCSRFLFGGSTEGGLRVRILNKVLFYGLSVVNEVLFYRLSVVNEVLFYRLSVLK